MFHFNIRISLTLLMLKTFMGGPSYEKSVRFTTKIRSVLIKCLTKFLKYTINLKIMSIFYSTIKDSTQIIITNDACFLRICYYFDPKCRQQIRKVGVQLTSYAGYRVGDAMNFLGLHFPRCTSLAIKY